MKSLHIICAESKPVPDSIQVARFVMSSPLTKHFIQVQLASNWLLMSVAHEWFALNEFTASCTPRSLGILLMTLYILLMRLDMLLARFTRNM